MCGIVGYVGRQRALPVVVDGLRRLEYRGYDSAGVALAGPELSVYKQAGRVDDLVLPDDDGATCAIGHTRWSTHGKPTDANAHPHVDCTGEVAVVHNGIVGNYEELKAELSDHVFRSGTDTEVVAHLVEQLRADNPDLSLRAVVERAAARLEGSFAVAVVAAGHDGIVCARQHSPLVVGHGEDGTHIASDVTAFLEHTRRATYVEDGDVVDVTPEGVTVYRDGEAVERPVQTVEWDAEDAEKGGHDHYMRKEIHEQPRALRQAIAGRVDDDGRGVHLDVSLDDELLRDLDELQLVACGTSYHAALYAKTLLQPLADVRVTAEVASEYAFEGGRDPERTLVVGVTQSGETADTVQALRRARAAGARTFAVTNTMGSTVTREVEDALFTRAGPEISVAATKTFSSQVVTLALFGVHLAAVRDRLDPTEAASLLADLQALPDAVESILDSPDVDDAVEAFAESDTYFYVGRRFGAPVALEGALKLKEISYDHAEGFPAGELKHGPLALVDDDTLVLAVLTAGARPAETLNNVREVQSRGASVVAIATGDVDANDTDATFHVPPVGRFEPLVANVYLQLFAYALAKRRGRPIDKPRNLAKSVTVE